MYDIMELRWILLILLFINGINMNIILVPLLPHSTPYTAATTKNDSRLILLFISDISISLVLVSLEPW